MRSFGFAAILAGASLICLLGAVSLLAGDEATAPLPGFAVMTFGAMIVAGVVLVAADALKRKLFGSRSPRYSASPFEVAGQPQPRAKYWEPKWPPPKWRL